MIESLDVRVVNDLAELPRLARSVHDFCERHQVPSAVTFSVNLALEEAVANVIDHGYDGAARHEIEVRLSIVGRTVRAEVVDDGRPFDPRDAKPPDVTAGIDERPIGGLGVFLTKQVMDDVQYHVVGRRNFLTLSKRIP